MTTKTNIIEIIEKLYTNRPIFHSEADFQFALAWKLNKKEEWSEIRLEKKMPIENSCYLDIWAKYKGQGIGFELKYVTDNLSMKHNDEQYELRKHSAYNVRCYDFIKDIERLEKLKDENQIAIGYAIFLTNCKSIFNSKLNDAGYDDFKIGASIEKITEGQHCWGKHLSEGTRKGREGPIVLNNCYPIEWSEYSTIDKKSKNAEFEYLLIEV